MLRRKIGEKVKINGYGHIKGVIVDNKEITTDPYYNKNWDYKVQLNKSCPEFACGENYDWQFFNDDELDILEKNYNLAMK